MNELSHHLIRFLPLLPQIIPQAICTRYGLSVGAKAAPVVRVLLILFFPVAYPISKVRYVLLL
jgi:metal transporter CNNM